MSAIGLPTVVGQPHTVMTHGGDLDCYRSDIIRKCFTTSCIEDQSRSQVESVRRGRQEALDEFREVTDLGAYFEFCHSISIKLNRSNNAL